MGILGMIGKMAGAKLMETMEHQSANDSELTEEKKFEQISNYCKYFMRNVVSVRKRIAVLKTETTTRIEQIQNDEPSFSEENGEIIDRNLKYLYLIRDFFIVLTKHACGLMLKDEEWRLVTEFAPFFDGATVLEPVDTEKDNKDKEDDSLLGTIKKIGRELNEIWIESFTFEKYLDRYSNQIQAYEMPDVDDAMETFVNTITAQSNPIPSVSNTTCNATECPKCGTKLAANAKFCPECGNKIEIKKPAFCIECGTPIMESTKFCPRCGTKLM